jgi:hypothetical protein
MTRNDLVRRVRAHTRDFNSVSFRQDDIIAYINEAIERVRQLVPQCMGMVPLLANLQEPILLPVQYQHLLAVYAAARCYGQDDRAYQASTLMNEFEVKLDEMIRNINSGDLVIVDENGDEVEYDGKKEYIDLKAYYGSRSHK